jgi:hypothetical protein
MVTVVPKRRVNEKGLNYLQQEVQQYQRTAGDLRKEVEMLRSDRTMLLDVLSEITEDNSIWVDSVEVNTMRFRLKNLLNNIKNG